MIINKSLIICSIVRNAEKGLRSNIPVIQKVCSCFKDYRIVIYENNSTDQTKSILAQWKEELGEKAYFVPKNYDAYLRMIYGDYMQLPPKEKQVTHHTFKARWK